MSTIQIIIGTYKYDQIESVISILRIINITYLEKSFKKSNLSLFFIKKYRYNTTIQKHTDNKNNHFA